MYRSHMFIVHLCFSQKPIFHVLLKSQAVSLSQWTCHCISTCLIPTNIIVIPLRMLPVNSGYLDRGPETAVVFCAQLLKHPGA